MSKRVLAVLVLPAGAALLSLLLLGGARAATDEAARDPQCQWISVAEVDRLLVDGAPWSAGETARNSCRFRGERNGQRLFLTLERTLHAEPDQAREQAARLRRDLAKLLVAIPEATIGEAGFSGHGKIDGGELVEAAGHRGTVFAQAIVADPSGTTQAQRAAMTAFVDIMLGDGSPSRADEPACPWLAPGIADELVPGGVLTHPNDTSCELRSDALRLVVEVEAHTTADDLVQYLHDPACTHEPVAALGGNARVVWNCPDLPWVQLLHAEDEQVVTYSLRGNVEATPKLRRQLVEVAVAMRTARSR